MASKLKKLLRIIGIVFGVIIGIVLVKCAFTFIPAFIAISSENRAEMEYYNQTLPSTEIELPYDIKEYEAVYLSNWTFTSLTAKVKEKKRDTDFWVFQDNYDILFGSNDHLYIRKDVPFHSKPSEDMVAAVTFSITPIRDGKILKVAPDLTEDEVLRFAQIVLSDETMQKDGQDDKDIVFFENIPTTYWDIIFDLKSTNEICYDGLQVQYDIRYRIVSDTDGNFYLKDSDGNYKLIPEDIAEKIKTGDCSVIDRE